MQIAHVFEIPNLLCIPPVVVVVQVRHQPVQHEQALVGVAREHLLQHHLTLARFVQKDVHQEPLLLIHAEARHLHCRAR